jgi:hypothetical protein
MTETTFRAIYTCRNRNCKHVWALEYRNEGTDRWGCKYGTRELNANESAVREDAYSQGRRSYHIDVMGDLRCPECRCNLPKGGQVQGHYSEARKCGAKCIAAKGPDCECQCGGENHGVGHLVGNVQKEK